MRRARHLHGAAWAALTLALAVLAALGTVAAAADARAEPRRAALVVGTSRYADPTWTALPNAASDAEQLGGVLEARFGYAVTRVVDGDRDAFKKALVALADGAEEDDDILVFVAGHGYFDAADRAGYLVLADADPACEHGCYPLDHVKRALYGTKARHALVLLDTCYAGTQDPALAFGALSAAGPPMTFRGPVLPAQQRELLREYAGARSRLVFSSVGKARALDGSAGATSPFMRVLLAELGRADAAGLVSLERIVLAMKEGPEPLPVVAPSSFQAAFPHDPNGTFYFVPVADLCVDFDLVRAAALAATEGAPPPGQPPWARVDRLAATLAGASECQRERWASGPDLVRCHFGQVADPQLLSNLRALERRLGVCERAAALDARVETACHAGTCALSVCFALTPTTSPP